MNQNDKNQNKEKTSKTVNRLIDEKSPYLLQHAHNPVNWYPWGEEAFAQAKKENKPIFLSIGYSTCHWCHVMERESFESPKVAEVMNRYFICIKVDREERPDVDHVYMSFVQASTGHGGWPLSAWLTPDLEPFAGGTYFPPEDRYGRPGFVTVLKNIAHAWETDQENIKNRGTDIVKALQDAATPVGDAVGKLDPAWITNTYRSIRGSYDAEEGGFGDAPKFPRPVTLNLLFRVGDQMGLESKEGKDAVEMALFTLKQMAQGGMYDHLGGGFHRYSVDAEWHVPHFEKMLYDQAQLVVSYLEAYQITRDPFYAKVAEDVLQYVMRDMTDEEGGFYSAEDADSYEEKGDREKKEGAFYVWEQKEIESILDKASAALFNRVYDVQEKGNVAAGSDPHGELDNKNVLIQRESKKELAQKLELSEEALEARLLQIRQKLFEVREKRPHPHLDDKIITAWNGLMISAFAKAHEVLEVGQVERDGKEESKRYLEQAKAAARFIREKLYDPKKGELIRSYRQGASDINGFAADYAFLIRGLIDLYEASGEYEWLEWAIELQKKQNELFWDEKKGGYFGAKGDDPHLLLRMKEDYDGAEPSSNSVSVSNLLKLGEISGESIYREKAEKTLSVFSDRLRGMGQAVPQLLVALGEWANKPMQVVMAGEVGKKDTNLLLAKVHENFHPHKVVLFADGKKGQDELTKMNSFFKELKPIDGKATVFVCRDFVCQLPTHDPDKVGEQIKKTGRKSDND